MMPLPRHTTWIDDTEKGTNVFVPGIMGAGVLLSLGIVIADFVNKLRGDEGARRQRELVASYVTGDVLRLVVAAGALLVAVYMLISRESPIRRGACRGLYSPAPRVVRSGRPRR